MCVLSISPLIVSLIQQRICCNASDRNGWEKTAYKKDLFLKLSFDCRSLLALFDPFHLGNHRSHVISVGNNRINLTYKWT